MTYTRKAPPNIFSGDAHFWTPHVLHGVNSYALSKHYKTFYEFFCQAVGFSVYKSSYAVCRYRNCIASFVELGVTGGSVEPHEPLLDLQLT